MANAIMDRAQRLMDAALALREARGETVRCPVCNAGIAKHCIGSAESHAARIALAKGN